MNQLMEQLTTLKRQGLIVDIDLEFCRFLMQVEPDVHESVIWAACLVSRAYWQGDVCLSIAAVADQHLFANAPSGHMIKGPSLKQWIARLKQSRLVGGPGDFTPLILDGTNRLYLHRIWSYEQQLATTILKKAQQRSRPVDEKILREGLLRLFPTSNEGVDWQQIAAAAAVFNQFTLISGGPGTGKTTTVVRLLALILEQARNQETVPAIALAAPTGKAAKRLQHSIMTAKESLPVDKEIKESIPSKAYTVHQLLGARRHSAQFRYDAENPLPYDFVVVDEASMIDQLLMSKLLYALPDHTQLVLLGDKDQLASVEAGAVMSDIFGNLPQPVFTKQFEEKLHRVSINIPANCITQHPQPLTNNIILLHKSYRFAQESGIGLLARAINEGDSQEVMAILQNRQYTDTVLHVPTDYSGFIDDVTQRSISHFKTVLELQDKNAVFRQYKRSIILAAHRRGPWGSRHINERIEHALQKSGLVPREQWYHGKPVMIRRNNYNLGLHNGDFGICLVTSDNRFRIFFERDGTLVAFPPSRLPEHSTAFAMTVHKSQGSEFDEVMHILPQEPSKILSRELLYTAVTRTKKQLILVGTKQIIQNAIQNKFHRNSGLKYKLWVRERTEMN